MSGSGILENVQCQRCRVSSWHPEARACTMADCELRGRAASMDDPPFHNDDVPFPEARNHVC